MLIIFYQKVIIMIDFHCGCLTCHFKTKTCLKQVKNAYEIDRCFQQMFFCDDFFSNVLLFLVCVFVLFLFR